MLIILSIFLVNVLFAQTVDNQIQNYLSQHFAGYDKVEYEFISQVNLKDIEIDFSKQIAIKSDVVFLPIRLKGKNQISFARLKVRLYKNVLVANKDIPINTNLNHEDFNYILKDVTKVRGSLVDTKNSLENYKTKFSIKKGDILISELIDEIPVVKSGEKLVVEVQKGSVLISLDGFARQNGKIGERIDVLTSLNEIVKAKVVNKNKAIVE